MLCRETSGSALGASEDPTDDCATWNGQPPEEEQTEQGVEPRRCNGLDDVHGSYAKRVGASSSETVAGCCTQEHEVPTDVVSEGAGERPGEDAKACAVARPAGKEEPS